MRNKPTNVIAILFYILFVITPLVLFPKTSELFEFNKIVFVYGLTILITAFWGIRMIVEKKVTLRRTILDLPLLIFLSGQLVSTFLSIDPRTSFLGYYSRFSGGFLSLFSYSLLYWAYVSNMNSERTIKALKIMLFSAIIVSFYAILQRTGVDSHLWVQDVKTRVFSTLGQPNWLAAWLVGLIPVIWAIALNLKVQLKDKRFWGFIILSALFFTVLLFTKSRSGLLGFATANVFFWAITFFYLKRKALVSFIVYQLSFIILIITIGTPWSPAIFSQTPGPLQPVDAPALEVGGTESGEIRKIVWKGVLDIWRAHPILGTGPETFAFAYYKFRPVEHNLVSEWEFLYNKAHNEYLNYLATTGIFGTISYLLLIAISLYLISNFKFLNPKQIQKTQFQNLKIRLIRSSLFAGFFGILVTNFFGFSVVVTSLQLFLYPAMVVVLTKKKNEEKETSTNLSTGQFAGIVIIAAFALLLFYSLAKYWGADIAYAKGKLENAQGNHVLARESLVKAVLLSPNEAIFRDELAHSSAGVAISLVEIGEGQKAEVFIEEATTQSLEAISLSPENVNLRRNRASLFIKLSVVDPGYLVFAKDVLGEAAKMAPTEAKLHYNLGLTLARIGQYDEALEVLGETIKLKPDYRDARFAYAIVLVEQGKRAEAKKELEYILEHIDPEDFLVRQQLEDIK